MEDCEQYITGDQALSVSCEDVASTLLSGAPSTLSVSGLRCNPAANGEYAIASRTVGGKPHWVLRDPRTGDVRFHLYAISECARDA